MSAQVRFPTELDDEIGSLLGERGREFGTVTGRQRRCGWFDAVLVRQSVKLSGMDGIALTKLDVLDGISEIKLCVGYKINGEESDYLPSSSALQAVAEPVYETLEGWSESTQGARSWAELPATAIKYIRRIEELIAAPVTLLSTSPERDDTIMVRDPFSVWDLTLIQLISTVRACLRRRVAKDFLAQGADFAYPGISGGDVTIWT